MPDAMRGLTSQWIRILIGLIVSLAAKNNAAIVEYPCRDEVINGRLPPQRVEIQQPISLDDLPRSGSNSLPRLTSPVGFLPVEGASGPGPLLRTDISFNGPIPQNSASRSPPPIQGPDLLIGKRYGVGVDSGPSLNLAPSELDDDPNTFRNIAGVPQIIRESIIVPRVQPKLGGEPGLLNSLFPLMRQGLASALPNGYSRTLPVVSTHSSGRGCGCSCT